MKRKKKRPTTRDVPGMINGLNTLIGREKANCERYQKNFDSAKSLANVKDMQEASSLLKSSIERLAALETNLKNLNAGKLPKKFIRIPYVNEKQPKRFLKSSPYSKEPISSMYDGQHSAQHSVSGGLVRPR
tara:strand:- start:38769 stop:39161 length:393 start_codon:yes stop_codon:yes gene_type:complete